MAGGPVGAIGLAGALRAIAASRLEVVTFGEETGHPRQKRLVEVHPQRNEVGSLVVRLTATCDTTGAIQRPSDQPGARRYERTDQAPPAGQHLVHRLPGRLRHRPVPLASAADAGLATEARSILGFTTRQALQQALEQRSERTAPPRPCKHGMIWPRSSRRASLPLNRPATFRLRVGCSASAWWLQTDLGCSGWMRRRSRRLPKDPDRSSG